MYRSFRAFSEEDTSSNEVREVRGESEGGERSGSRVGRCAADFENLHHARGKQPFSEKLLDKKVRGEGTLVAETEEDWCLDGALGGRLVP